MFDLFKSKFGKILNSPPKPSTVEITKSFSAGEELLDKYESNWSEISALNHENSDLAQQIAYTINEIYERCESDRKASTTIIELFGETGLDKLLDKCVCELESLSVLIPAIEQELVSLEKYLDDVDVQNEAYRKEKLTEEKNQQLKLEQEKLREEHLAEISKDFEEKFRNDLKNFKEHGKVVQRSNIEESNIVKDLADIDLDVSEDDFHQFLAE